MGYKHDLAGREFGKWTVIRFFGNEKAGQSTWICRCVCGKERPIPIGNLKSGLSTQCTSCSSKNSSITHNMSRTLVYSYWLTHRKKFTTRWRKNITHFNDECWASRTHRTQQLLPIDKSFLIGPDNYQWEINPMKKKRQQEVAEYLVAKGVCRELANQRVSRLSRQRIYQLLNEKSGLCQCGKHLGENTNCRMCQGYANKNKIKSLLANGYILASEATSLTGLSLHTILRYCRHEKHERFIINREDVEKLIVPDGWVRVSHAGQYSRMSDATAYNRAISGQLESRRIGGGLYVRIENVKKICRKARTKGMKFKFEITDQFS